MENTIENKHEGMFKPALNYALIISVVLIIISLVFYLAGSPTSNAIGYIGYVVVIAGLAYAAIMYRNEVLGGYITYGKSLGFILVIGLITGVLLGIYNFIFLSYIAPEVLDIMKEEITQKAYETAYQINPNISDAELDNMIDLQLRFQNPPLLAVFTIIGYTFQALIFGLIISIFVKRKNPDFV